MALDRELFTGKSRMHATMRDFDWAASSFGAPDSWPKSLRAIVSLMLDCAFPTCLAWGPELRLLYNDAYLPIAEQRDPGAFGARMQDVWGELWPAMAAIVQRTLAGESGLFERFPVEGVRDGRTSRRWFTLTFSPVHDDEDRVAGLMCIGSETTEQVLMERHHAFQLRLSDHLRGLSDPDEITAHAARLLGTQLGMARVGYLDVDEAAKTISAGPDWTNGELPSLAGTTMSMDDFGAAAIAQLREGRTLKVDVAAEKVPAAPPTHGSMGTRSMLAVPLFRNGRLCAVLQVHGVDAHPWTEDEVELAEEAAERTRDAVERAIADVEAARAQSALRAERDRNQYVLDSITEGFALLGPDCTLLQMNAEGLRIGQLTADQAIGRKAADVWPKARGSRLGDLYRDVKATGKAGALEYKRTLPDGRPCWIEIRAFPALGGGMAVFYRDISKRKLAEEKLTEADRRKDEFVATLAHELRNPIAPIAAAAEILSLPGLKASEVKQAGEVISRQVGHMTDLVNDLLDISRITSGRVKLHHSRLDINEVVPEAVEQAQPLIKSHAHHLEVHLAARPALVWGDRHRLVQVLANLLNNAAKYTPRGGRIAVRVEPQVGRVTLVVRDNGIGMPPDLVESAFELFAQAERTPDRTQGGLGIGLALVKGIVELHGGTVSAHSAGLGLGSEFRVSLPRLPAPRLRVRLQEV